MMGLVTSQLADLKAERQILLDRLATLGLGGPLFSLPCSAESSENTPEEPVDPEAEEIEKLMKSRRRPSKLADALTRKAYRDYNRVQTGAHVKWVAAALDEAEALGKKTSLSG
jgi:hypothetical protein